MNLSGLGNKLRSACHDGKCAFYGVTWAFLGLIAVLVLNSGRSPAGRSQAEGEKLREFANELYNRDLYPQAVREYQNYLDLYKMEDSQRAGILLTIANVYFERLHDYENAMAYYLKLKTLYPGSTLSPQADPQIVACLERLQRSADAKQALDEATGLASGPGKSMPGKVVAKIGDRAVTSGDLEYQIRQLPDYLRSQFKDRKSKLEFLRQYLATELFFDAAKRKKLEDDKDVIEASFQAKKNLMVQKYLEQEIAPQIRISSGDVQMYYKANPDKYAEKDAKGKTVRVRPLGEVQKQVTEDLVREKQQEAYGQLIQRMMTAEKVAVYDDLVD
jgi:hypothetical protein